MRITYYHDHKAEFDREMVELDDLEAALRTRTADAAIAEKLRRAQQARQ